MRLRIKRYILDRLPVSLLYWVLKLKNLPFSFLIRRKNIGKGSFIAASVQIIGLRNVRIGKNSTIGEDTLININQRKTEKVCVKIGDNCIIGRRNFIASGNYVSIGDYCLFGAECKLLGADHIYDSPFVPYITSGETREGSILIRTNCHLGSGVIVLKGVDIGYGCIIGAGTVVNCNIPPLSIVVGNPVRIIKRFDMELNAWVDAKDYKSETDKKLLSENEYLKILKQKYPVIGPAYYSATNKMGDLL